jgi:hypothetical protein
MTGYYANTINYYADFGRFSSKMAFINQEVICFFIPSSSPWCLCGWSREERLFTKKRSISEVTGPVSNVITCPSITLDCGRIFASLSSLPSGVERGDGRSSCINSRLSLGGKGTGQDEKKDRPLSMPASVLGNGAAAGRTRRGGDGTRRGRGSPIHHEEGKSPDQGARTSHARQASNRGRHR